MLWLLVAMLVVLLSLAIFTVSSLSLWRATKVLTRQVSATGETVEQLTGSLGGAHAVGAPVPGEQGDRPCPTCGAAPRSVSSRPSGVSARAR